MHDAVIFERLGVASTVVITDPFQGLAARFAESLGMPGYHFATVRHPISSASQPALAEVAAAIVPTVIRQLLEEC